MISNIDGNKEELDDIDLQNAKIYSDEQEKCTKEDENLKGKFVIHVLI